MEDSRDMLLRSGAARVPRGYALVKPVVDRIAGAALLVLLAPVLGCVALVLKCTSEGPVFYSQVRLGHRGRPFRIHKFRTMTHCCEDQTGPVWSSQQCVMVRNLWMRNGRPRCPSRTCE